MSTLAEKIRTALDAYEAGKRRPAPHVEPPPPVPEPAPVPVPEPIPAPPRPVLTRLHLEGPRLLNERNHPVFL
jgi:hypothetical protein